VIIGIGKAEDGPICSKNFKHQQVANLMLQFSADVIKYGSINLQNIKRN